MQERQVSIEGTTRRLPDPFLVLATQNPVEFEGTFALPQAQLDRFLLRARVGYPDADGRAADRAPATRTRPSRSTPSSPSSTASASSRSATASGRCASPTRSRPTSSRSSGRPASHPDLELGASPRATVALYRVAQAAAVLEGRAFVTPDDVKARRPGRPRRTGWSSTSTGASTARPPTRCWRRSWPSGRRRRPSRRTDRRTGLTDRWPARVLAGDRADRDRERARRPDRDPARARHAAARGRPRGLGARRASRDVRYSRHLGARRAAFGDEIAAGRSRSGTAAACRSPGCAPTTRRRPGVERRASATSTDGAEPGTEVLRNAWTLRPWERVVRRFHVGADRRGVFTHRARRPLGRATRSRAAPPRSCGPRPTRSWSGRGRSPPPRSSRPTAGATSSAPGPASPRTRRGSPGVRPYAPGDPMRRIHARTSARVGRPMTKRFEPSRDREVLIALDVQTVDGPAWEAGFGTTTTSSRCTWSPRRSPGRSALRRVAFGLMAAGYTGAETRIAQRAGLVGAGPGRSGCSTCSPGCRPTRPTPFERLLRDASRGRSGPGRPCWC